MRPEPAARVSVVIPAWDAYAGEMLLQAVSSVQRQGVPAEIIVVDNASTVALPALPVADIVRLDHRSSTGAARNAALERVHTPYVVFLDADDLLLPGGLAALITGLDAADRFAVAHTLSILDGVTGRRHRSPRRVARVLCHFPRLFAFLNAVWSLLPTQGATIMRSDEVRASGGYADSSQGEDWVLATSLAFRGRVSIGSRPALCYRQRDDSPGAAALNASLLLDNAKRVRARIREDPAIPTWVRRLLPLIAAAQWTTACIAHPAYRAARARRLREPRAALVPTASAPTRAGRRLVGNLSRWRK